MPPKCEIRNLIPEAQRFVNQTLREMPKDRTGRFASGGLGHADAVLALMLKTAAEGGMPHDKQREFWKEAGK